MAMGQNDRFRLQTARMDHAQAAAAGIDVGLRSYMLRVYNYMCIRSRVRWPSPPRPRAN